MVKVFHTPKMISSNQWRQSSNKQINQILVMRLNIRTKRIFIAARDKRCSEWDFLYVLDVEKQNKL